MRTRRIAASSVSTGKTPGNKVKPLISLFSATRVAASALEPCCTGFGFATEVPNFAAELPTAAGLVDAFKAGVRGFECHLIQLTAPTRTAAAPRAHAAITAVRRTFGT